MLESWIVGAWLDIARAGGKKHKLNLVVLCKSLTLPLSAGLCVPKLLRLDPFQAFIHRDIKVDHSADLAERVAQMRIYACRAFKRQRLVLFRGQRGRPANQLIYKRRFDDRFLPAIGSDLRTQMRAISPP